MFSKLVKQGKAVQASQPAQGRAEQTVSDEEKRKLEYRQELRETAWGLIHLPQRNFGWPWRSEMMNIRESINGIATPFSDTAGEKRQHESIRQNAVRREVRRLFSEGKTRQDIAGQLSGMAAGDDTSIPLDIKMHYGWIG